MGFVLEQLDYRFSTDSECRDNTYSYAYLNVEIIDW